MPPVRNPILPGFNPDPSVLRVGDDYYIATSTFEWYPGVQIHHSKDLANWELVSPRPLNRAKQLDMRGDPDSGGVWAPCLTHDGDKFYLVYTDVKRKDGDFKDTHNYIVTADKAEGPWSDPIYTTSSGFDPSLFHDPDTGKKYFINMICDHRRRPQFFEGIVMQEFDASKGAMVGPRKNIYRGSDLGLVEGPHLYKRNGWYYLLTAEGGTAYGHAATLARSRDIWGPYETHPEKHIVSSKDSPFAALQRSGHGDIVDTPDGKKTYLVHLCGRPVTQERRCVLGRETAIQECEWRDDDWLYVKNGPVPSLYVEVPGTRDDDKYWAEQRYTFSPGPSPSSSGESSDRDTAADALHKDFQWLRTPLPSRILSLTDTPGALTLYGRESPGSWFEQSLVARRQTHFSYDAETVLSAGYSPVDPRQLAGLTAYYCRFNFFYLAVSGTNDDFYDETSYIEPGERELVVLQSEGSYPGSKLSRPMVEPVRLPSLSKFDGRIKLRVEVRGGEQLRFYYALEDLSAGSGAKQGEEPKWGELTQVGPVLDASILSDECGGHLAHGSFTGAFVGMSANDVNGTGLPARFEGFVYKPVKGEADRYEV
ncbi:putative beta-xylosidase [Microdochium bolleyi]|uniref:Putative beta-xylosidase n=1 Tax=Microdochium bolleyi TaxID=196109 RepID=A0A136J3E7_9PEZI|nr:putative beta-xylosidase [Microdochium bolleyi]